MVMGATHVLDTQAAVEKQMYLSDPFSCLERPDGKAVWQVNDKSFHTQSESSKNAFLPRQTMPKSTSTLNYIGQQIYRSKQRVTGNTQRGGLGDQEKQEHGKSLKSALKSTSDRLPPLPESFDTIRKPQLVGTCSAKLSYLLDRVMELQRDEKILIFYEAQHIAWYIAQALEILQVEHRIYASGIKIEMRSKYLNEFNNGEAVRVMLMDLKQAAHGLHVASASRVFFVNPVWSPSVEAQAIKRAHRIRSSRPVHVETLVLRNTLEHAMLLRRKDMTTQEHDAASRSPLDDMRMRDIIEKADFIEILDQEILDEQMQMATLGHSHQLYGREFVDSYKPQQAPGIQSSGEPESNGCLDEDGSGQFPKEHETLPAEIRHTPTSKPPTTNYGSSPSSHTEALSGHRQKNEVLKSVEPNGKPLKMKRKANFVDELGMASKRPHFADGGSVDMPSSSGGTDDVDRDESPNKRKVDIMGEGNTPIAKKIRFAV